MRHRNKKNSLAKTKAPKKALIKNTAANLIIYEKIKTTQARAKLIRPFVEKLITKSKKNNLQSLRHLKQNLYLENAVKKVNEVLVPRYQNRNGGYTRITKLGPRKGDGAPTVIIELIKDETSK